MGFKPGQSGNPGGRPKALVSLVELARSQTEASILTLIAIRDKENAPEGARVSAAQALLDRGWGKAPQVIEAVVAHSHAVNTAFLDSLPRDKQEELSEFLAGLLGNAATNGRTVQ